MPMVIIMLVMCIGGSREENEDLVLMKLRREREVKSEVEASQGHEAKKV